MKSIFEYHYLAEHKGPKYKYIILEHPVFKSNYEMCEWLINSNTNQMLMARFDIDIIIDFRLVCNAESFILSTESWDEVKIEDMFKIFLESQQRIDSVTYEQQYANIATALHDQLFDYSMSIIKIVEIVTKVTAMSYQITSKTMGQIIDYMNSPSETKTEPKPELNS